MHEERSVAHRYVKADNFLLGYDDGVRLGDLGLATQAGETQDESKERMSTEGMATLFEQRGFVV